MVEHDFHRVHVHHHCNALDIISDAKFQDNLNFSDQLGYRFLALVVLLVLADPLQHPPEDLDHFGLAESPLLPPDRVRLGIVFLGHHVVG